MATRLSFSKNTWSFTGDQEKSNNAFPPSFLPAFFTKYIVNEERKVTSIRQHYTNCSPPLRSPTPYNALHHFAFAAGFLP